MTLSRPIHVAADGLISFFLMAEEYSVVYTCHVFIHLFVNGHVDCFHALVTVNSAAMNIGCMYLRPCFSLDIHLAVGLQGHLVALFLT